MNSFYFKAMNELADRHEQEKMDLRQQLIQDGRHGDVEDALKELEKRQQEVMFQPHLCTRASGVSGRDLIIFRVDGNIQNKRHWASKESVI